MFRIRHALVLAVLSSAALVPPANAADVVTARIVSLTATLTAVTPEGEIRKFIDAVCETHTTTRQAASTVSRCTVDGVSMPGDPLSVPGNAAVDHWYGSADTPATVCATGSATFNPGPTTTNATPHCVTVPSDCTTAFVLLHNGTLVCQN